METPSKKKDTLCGGTDSKTEKAKESPLASSSSSSQSTQNGTFKAPITNPMLTPEDWDLIFQDLKSKDFQSVINTCPEWNHLLHSRKRTELLPLVLPILMEFGHLKFEDILLCRKINKETKSEIDDTIEQEISTPSKSFKNEMKRRCKEDCFSDIVLFKDYFGDHNRIQEFIRHVESRPMSSSITNPFLGRKILLVLRGSDENNLREGFSPLLSQHGHYLWSISVGMFTSVNCYIATLLSLLNHTPNLKMLKIMGSVDVTDDLKKMQNNMRFPTLSHLESLDFECLRNPEILPTEQLILIPFLVSYGRQLTTFRCRGPLFQRPGLEADFLNRMAPNVKQLSLTHFNKNDGPIFPLSLGELGTFYQLKWPVEHFHLFKKEHLWEYDTKAFIQHLYAAVSQFSNTLVQLDLLVKLKKSEGFAMKDELKGGVLPKLKIMKSVRSNVLLSEFWTFMKLRCGQLRELHLRCCSEDCCIANKHAEIPASMQAFQMLPKLDRILFHTGEEGKPVIWTRRDVERDQIKKN